MGGKVRNLAINYLRKINSNNKNLVEIGSCCPCTLYPLPIYHQTAWFSLAEAIGQALRCSFSTVQSCLNNQVDCKLPEGRGHVLPTFVFHEHRAIWNTLEAHFTLLNRIVPVKTAYAAHFFYFFNKGFSLKLLNLQCLHLSFHS